MGNLNHFLQVWAFTKSVVCSLFSYGTLNCPVADPRFPCKVLKQECQIQNTTRAAHRVLKSKKGILCMQYGIPDVA